MQMYNSVTQRNLIMAERTMLKHAEPIKVLSTFGSNKPVPQNKTDTVVFRRPVPIDAGANGAPDVDINNYLLAEGQTPVAGGITYEDVQVTLQQYGVLLKISNKAELMYEDDIPGDMVKLVGEHMGTIEELISYGVVRGGTNVVYANGTARSAVNSPINLNRLRQVARVMEAAHASRVTEKLASGPDYDTSAIMPGYLVFHHTNVDADVRNIPGFTPTVKYASGGPVHEREIGAVEQFRFINSPYFKPFLNSGAAVLADTFLVSNGNGAGNCDIYPVMVVAKDAWGQVALKGMDAIDPVYLPAKVKTHANPMGAFGYVGANFWKNALLLNQNWIVRYEVAVTAL